MTRAAIPDSVTPWQHQPVEVEGRLYIGHCVKPGLDSGHTLQLFFQFWALMFQVLLTRSVFAIHQSNTCFGGYFYQDNQKMTKLNFFLSLQCRGSQIKLLRGWMLKTENWKCSFCGHHLFFCVWQHTLKSIFVLLHHQHGNWLTLRKVNCFIYVPPQ